MISDVSTFVQSYFISEFVFLSLISKNMIKDLFLLYAYWEIRTCERHELSQIPLLRIMTVLYYIYFQGATDESGFKVIERIIEVFKGCGRAYSKKTEDNTVHVSSQESSTSTLTNTAATVDTKSATTEVMESSTEVTSESNEAVESSMETTSQTNEAVESPMETTSQTNEVVQSPMEMTSETNEDLESSIETT